MFVALLCSILATQQIAAVVNNSKSVSLEESTSNKTASSATKVPDSVPSGTEQEAKRRDAPLSDSYGVPISGGGLDSYVPTGLSNTNLPIPVYGVPDAPSNNIVYPAPPPDIPPPLPQNYGAPFKTYGPPQLINNFDLGHSTDFVPPPPPSKYLPQVRPHKTFSPPSHHGLKLSRPRPQYGPPHKPIFAPKLPKPNYGPPKQVYGPPKQPLFVPQKHNFKQQQSVTIVTIPQNNYGVPNGNHDHGHSGFIQPPPSIGHGHFGPPDPVPHGPPHPGVPAPPTPPDIKYDGWQPIPGLVSRPPDTYGTPEVEHHGTADLQLNADFVPPPIEDGHGHGSTSLHSIGLGYSPPSQGVSDSYGAPLNSVTGSGAVVSSSGDEHHDDESLSLGLNAAGINSGHSHLSVIKSIGYEIFPNTGGGLSHIGDTYSAPPLSSYSADGPYAAAHSYKSNELSSSSFTTSIKSHGLHESFGSSHGLRGSHVGQGLHTNIGLIPPSGVYGAPPSSHYGTPLLTKPSHQYGPPLNALKINPPKHPVIFREPVPQGLIESIGQHTAHKDAHGVIESTHASSFSSGPTYIPPPIPDITKPVKEEEPLLPSNLYSLPHANSAVSFQNIAHGTSSFDFGSSNFGSGQHLTSYTAPLGSIDGSYGLPVHSASDYSLAFDNAHSGGLTVGIDNSHPPVTIDLTSATSNVGPTFAQISHGYGFQNVHDCSSHKSQPLPSLSYGVPSANSYTASLSSLTTNIGGPYHGSGDLATAHSQKISTGVSINSIHNTSQEKNYGKSLAQKFGPGAELIKSESLDINNIPVQGSLGSYTLQIQSADGLNGPQSSSGPVPHAQVLNDGLLHSILAAIEQPRQDTKILGQPLSKFQPSASYNEPFVSDSDGQHSVTNPVVVPSPVTEASTTTTTEDPESESETDTPLDLIDNNEIALYFSNKLQDADNGSQKNNTREVSDNVLNGQQYGSYVSFKTPNTSFVYGNLPSDKAQD